MMDYTKLLITYTNDDNSFVIPYTLRNNSIVPRWIERVQLAQQQYPIDDPGRFYGFGSIEQQINESLFKINQCIDIINNFEPIIKKTLTDVNDYDTLNYLHHIFEEYHGLLDQQDHPFWTRSPTSVRTALADLNICVHRCESASRGAPRRHVVTYYGLPKTETLTEQDYSLFEPKVQFGTVYLNYVEIGKTLEDLTIDRDEYISDDAFKPWNYYSADFNVKFWQDDPVLIEQLDVKISEYYDSQKEFFESRGYSKDDYRLVRGGIPLADLDEPAIGKDFYRDHIVTQLNKHQWVKSVTFE